jgi:hypothetical protein
MGQGAYIHGLYEDMACTVDKIMKNFVRDDDWLLNTVPGFRSAFYGLRYIIKTLVWLHYYLNG